MGTDSDRLELARTFMLERLRRVGESGQGHDRAAVVAASVKDADALLEELKVGRGFPSAEQVIARSAGRRILSPNWLVGWNKITPELGPLCAERGWTLWERPNAAGAKAVAYVPGADFDDLHQLLGHTHDWQIYAADAPGVPWWFVAVVWTVRCEYETGDHPTGFTALKLDSYGDSVFMLGVYPANAPEDFSPSEFFKSAYDDRFERELAVLAWWPVSPGWEPHTMAEAK